jgi:hypothetical protein
MPIRTPRGRGAAYRPVWQWPLRSPGRLVGCLLVLLAAGLAGNALAGHFYHPHSGGTGIFADTGGDNTGTAAPPTGLERPPPAAPTRLPPVAELSPATLPPAAAPTAALTVATRWTQAWARHPTGTTTDQWVARLRPYTTDEYLGVLSTVDPSNVPASRVTGPARPILVSPNSVRVEVPTDAVDLVVLVVNTGSGDWKVAGYDRADAAPR